MVYVVGIILGILCLVMNAITSSNLFILSLILITTIALVVLMYLCNYRNMFNIGKWITVIFVADFVFPVIFFFLGGAYSAMATFFVISMVLIYFLFRGRSLVIMLLIHFAIIIFIYTFAHLNPELVSPLTPIAKLFHQIIGLALIGTSIGMIIKLMSNLYQSEQEKSDKVNRELEAERQAISNIFDANPHINMLLDENLTVLDCNEDAITSLGFQSQESFFAEFIVSIVHMLRERQACNQEQLDEKLLCVKEQILKLTENSSMIFDSELMTDKTIHTIQFTLRRIPYRGGFALVAYGVDMTKEYRMRDDLIHRDMLLSAISLIAQRLLTPATSNLDEDLHYAMGTLATTVDIDRMYVWRNYNSDSHLAATRLFEWLAVTETKDVKTHGISNFVYSETLPTWEGIFKSGGVINGPVSEMREFERSVLEASEIVSIVAIPINILDRFWGFVSFEDVHKEHRFNDEEIRLLRSSSLMIVSAIERAQAEKQLAERLMQQELMAEISSRFISPNLTGELINDALRVISEFLDCDRVLVITVDKEKDICTPMYSWSADEKWNTESEYIGYSEVISATFPDVAPNTGYAPPFVCSDVHSGQEGKYRLFSKADVHSFIWAPLYVEEKFWGLISIEDCVERRDWSDSDVQLVSTLSSALAGAVTRMIMDEELDKALDEALRASQAKSDFLSHMSHEIRTPMNAVIGMTSIGLSAKNLRRKDEALLKIESASSHLLGVINDILDMSKIEANKLEVNPVNFDFERMLQKVANVISVRSEENKQRFYVSIDQEIPEILVGDDQLISQVITNLLANAVKFTPAGGIIKLDAEYVSHKYDMYTIRILVSDTGIGISEEQKPKLFNIFEQAESGISRKFGGTGLGLAISKRIMDLLGGEIQVESELGKGSVFSFCLTLKRGEDKQRKLEPHIKQSGIRILAVVSQEDDVAFFQSLSERINMFINIIPTAEKAQLHLKTNDPYDIYFINLLQPGMDGFKLARFIRKKGDTNSIVLMSSGAECRRIELGNKEVEINRYLCKPLFPSTVVGVIQELIGVERMVSDAEGRARLALADNFSDKRVLLVEDIEVNREIVIELLRSTHIRIEEAENGLVALQKFEKNPRRFDMIFMDMQMPEMDGLESTRKIRLLSDPWAKQIPIVAMTANVFREDVEKCLDAGMNDHLGKPINLNELLVCLRKYLALQFE